MMLNEPQHVWLGEANYRACQELEGSPARPFFVAALAPASCVGQPDAPFRISQDARTLSCACELFVEVGVELRGATAEAALSGIRGYRVGACWRDTSLSEAVVNPTPRDLGICAIYGRWRDGFNIIGELRHLDQFTLMQAQMTIAVEGFSAVITSATDYMLSPGEALSWLSRTITVQPGDLISLGRAGPWITVPADQCIQEGAMVRAEIAGLPAVQAVVIDQRVQL